MTNEEHARMARRRTAKSLRRSISSWELIIEQNEMLAKLPGPRGAALARIAIAKTYRDVDQARLAMLERDLDAEREERFG